MCFKNHYSHFPHQFIYNIYIHKAKSNTITGLDRPWGFQEAEAPRFQDSQHMKEVSMSALCTSRLYSPGNIPGTHLCWRLSQPQGHSVAGRIMSMKKSNDPIGNRTRDLPACNAVPQPTASPHTPYSYIHFCLEITALRGIWYLKS